MNKMIITGIVFLSIILSSAPLLAQQDNASENIRNQEEDIIGGIGGTGIRSMDRPEILERPEQFERPERLESREALEDVIDRDFTTDSDIDSPELVEQPELPQTN